MLFKLVSATEHTSLSYKTFNFTYNLYTTLFICHTLNTMQLPSSPNENSSTNILSLSQLLFCQGSITPHVNVKFSVTLTLNMRCNTGLEIHFLWLNLSTSSLLSHLMSYLCRTMYISYTFKFNTITLQPTNSFFHYSTQYFNYYFIINLGILWLNLCLYHQFLPLQDLG